MVVCLVWGLTVFLLISVCFSQLDDSQERQSTFDDVVVDRLESEFEQLNVNDKKSMLHKIGVLGVYFRIYKQLVPVAGGDAGYLYRFPEPVPDLDTKLSGICETSLSVSLAAISKR
ncbi:hypothetical protein RB195_000881 [Necator americanus]|uniref:Uncharacterized protein n=1 Tax=Necator americanus TaxID=51031 RepID=A0ABR1DBV4_NECAM